LRGDAPAVSQFMEFSSTRRRINSATAMAGWVSFIWMERPGAGQQRALRGLLDLDDVLQGEETKKTAVPDATACPDLLVVWVENLGDVFGVDLVPDGGEEITGVEAFNVE